MAFSLDTFNERQRQAILHTDGPLLVISGAGTGKTHLLTGRILYLIQEKNIAADTILALTFNEKAAAEMIDRIENRLPLGHTPVAIYTFHGLCERILRERGMEIGISPDYKILQSADMWIFLKKHITEFKLDYFHSIGNPQKFFGEFTNFVSRLQDEDISPESYLKFAQDQSKNAASDEEKEEAVKHLELAQAYATYERLLLENGYLDFGGLLYYSLRLLETRASVKAAYQKRFSYVVVDEFQDTNFSQNKLVTLLAEKHKNLCVVGDDDQSIYKWRGASLTNINYFRAHFPGAATVVLNENYRSTQAILDAAYSLILNNNPDRLEVTEAVDKKLIATKNRVEREGEKVLNEVPEIAHFSELSDEVDFVITKAVGFVRKGKNVAILVRTNAMAKPFIDSLSRKKVAFQHFSSSDVWNRHSVKDCLATLRVIADPWDDVALFRLASLPYWNIPMEALLEKTKKVKGGSSTLFDEFGLDTTPSFTQIKQILTELIEFSRTHSTGELLGKFLYDTGYVEKAAQEDPSAVEDLAAFSEKVAAFEQTHDGSKVSDFLLYAQMLEESGEGSISGAFIDPTIIKVLTIHASKGLEFDCVFVPGMSHNKFPSIHRKDPLEVPSLLIVESLPASDHHLQEERRLFYVAITRAREKLTLSYSDFYDGKRQWKPSLFLAEIVREGRAIEKNITSRNKGVSHQQIVFPFEDGKKKFITIPKLSFSQLDTFSACPLKYQFRYLYSIPSPPGANASFGISIHNTLKSFYEQLQISAKKDINFREKDLTSLMTECFENNWIATGYENRRIQEDQKKRGLAMVLHYYIHERDALIIPAFLEKPFALEIGPLTLSGRIDRIDKLADGTYEVIDYKTGKIDEKTIKKNLQLSVYALACRDVLNITVSKLSLYSIPELKKISTTRSEKELDACKEEILEVASEMSNSNFEPKPGYQCRYCEYRLICPAAAD